MCGQQTTNPGLQSAMATKLCMVTVYICGALVWTVFHLTVLAHINLRWLQEFWKMCVLLGMDIITVQNFSDFETAFMLTYFLYKGMHCGLFGNDALSCPREYLLIFADRQTGCHTWRIREVSSSKLGQDLTDILTSSRETPTYFLNEEDKPYPYKQFLADHEPVVAPSIVSLRGKVKKQRKYLVWYLLVCRTFNHFVPKSMISFHLRWKGVDAHNVMVRQSYCQLLDCTCHVITLTLVHRTRCTHLLLIREQVIYCSSLHLIQTVCDSTAC